MDEEELCLKFCANTVSANNECLANECLGNVCLANEGMFNEEMYKEYMASEGMYSKCIENESMENECIDEIVDVEVILPINEFDLLQEAHSIRNITPEILAASDERYRRYILTINDWSDRNDNDYSYVKNVIYEYLGTSVFETRKRFMKYINHDY
jgi:hypothetical protein